MIGEVDERDSVVVYAVRRSRTGMLVCTYFNVELAELGKQIVERIFEGRIGQLFV